jgi:hypothetical protein
MDAHIAEKRLSGRTGLPSKGLDVDRMRGKTRAPRGYSRCRLMSCWEKEC